MTVLEGIEAVLAAAGSPMHYRDIATAMIDRDIWQTSGKTPWDTVSAQLAVNVKALGAASAFQRTARGIFALRAWGLPDFDGPLRAPDGDPGDTATAGLSMVDEPGTDTGAVEAMPAGGSDVSAPVEVSSGPSPVGRKPLRFTDAAEQVLARFGQDGPVHYREITRKARELGLLTTEGKTPEATLYSVILTEIERAEKRGQTPRFVKHGKGMISLAHGTQSGMVSLARGAQSSIVEQIKQHNMRLHQQLLLHLKGMPPQAFEELIGKVLGEIGFEEITNTTYSSDGGIDVRGLMVVGGVVRTTMAVQAKRWKSNVQAPVVQQVRGSLGTHEQGLIITTSDFSSGARKEAQRENAVPVALMNGEQLVDLLFEHGIGVQRTTHDLFALSAEWDSQGMEARPISSSL